MKNLDTIEAYFEGTNIHEEKRVGTSGAVALIAAVVLTLLHGYNSWLFFSAESISFGKAFAFHTVLSLASGFLAFVFSGVDRESRFLLLLFISTATLGVFGAAGTTLAILLHLWYMRYSLSFANWFNSIFPSVEESINEQVFDDIRIGRDESSKPYSVISFMDVIKFGSEAQKRMALSKMTSRFHHSFAPAFKQALNDSSNNIRIQAATAISKIENQFMARLMKLNDLLEENPQNPVIIMAIAEHYDNYAFTGILDEDREKYNREQALHYYKQLLELEPDTQSAYVKIGRLHLRSNQPEQALSWLRKSTQRGHQSPALITWIAEALYACGQFDELRQLAQTSPWQEYEDRLNPAVVEALTFWMEPTLNASTRRELRKAYV